MTDRVFILSNNPILQGAGVLRVPHLVSEQLSPLYSLAFVQLMAYYVAQTNSTWASAPADGGFQGRAFGQICQL